MSIVLRCAPVVGQSIVQELPATIPWEAEWFDGDQPMRSPSLTLNEDLSDTEERAEVPLGDTLSKTAIRVGYHDGFLIASSQELEDSDKEYDYLLRISGWGQLRHTVFDSTGPNRDLNQLQLKRARVILSGNAFNPDFSYFVQFDCRSSSGDTFRILDYFMTYDFGHRNWNLDKHAIAAKAGMYKIPFSMARAISAKELEFTDRSMASMYFDANRSLAVGLYGHTWTLPRPVYWEVALFNGLVTGGAETGSSGALDNNGAISGRLHWYPTGEWGPEELADLSWHEQLATRMGTGAAFTKVNAIGTTEFNEARVVDSGLTLASILPDDVYQYDVGLYAVDASFKYRGFSGTCEYYFRNLSGFEENVVPNLFDHGFWLQLGYFLIPAKLQVHNRWSRVVGRSGSLGASVENSNEVASGLTWYVRGEHVKLTADITHLDGAPISSPALDIFPGDRGLLYRAQVQFSF